MATRSSSYSPTAAPWRATFLEHVSKLDDPYMAVSTVGRDPKTGAPVPRVRYCGYRCLFGDLDLHPSAAKQLEEEKETNPPVYETDMLTFTTDVRMEKTENFKDFDGAIEVAFWVKDVMTQWRIRGKAFVVGDDPKKQSEKEARSEISKGLRKKADQQASVDEKDWTWEKEIASYFANHSPVMRGSFRNPPPGRPISDKPDDPNLKLGQKVADLHDAIARSNFRVVVVRIDGVDRLDLTKPEEAQRWKYTFNAAANEDGKWEEVEVWP